MRTRILLLLALCFLHGASALAETEQPRLVVSELASGDEKSLTLPKGSTARITVHLSSAGEMVADYKVFVVRDSDRESIQAGISDPIGVVNFQNIPAGEYTLVLSKTQRQRSAGTVQIGDFVLSLDKKPKSNGEETLGSDRNAAHE